MQRADFHLCPDSHFRAITRQRSLILLEWYYTDTFNSLLPERTPPARVVQGKSGVPVLVLITPHILVNVKFIFDFHANRVNTTANQEYQLWLEEEGGTKIGTRIGISQWIRTGEYTFKDIDLKPNTRYIPHIVTRRYDEEGMKRIISTEIEISNREIAYTNGEGISKARFVPPSCKIA